MVVYRGIGHFMRWPTIIDELVVFHKMEISAHKMV